MDNKKAGYIEGTVSIIANTGLFAIKFWAGITTGSIALTADAWHTLSDSISSIVVIIATKLSSKEADKKHPFGHGRWEQIAALFIAFLLTLIAYDFLKDAIIQFSQKETPKFGTLAIVVTSISIVIKEALAQYAFYLARQTGNVSIKADGWHHRTDALSSVVVLIGILLAGKLWWIDSVLGLIISLMLFYASFEIVKEAINKLLGEKPSPELTDKILALIKNEHEHDLNPHHFHIHNYVTHKELTFHIKFDNDTSLVDAHKIATDIESKILTDYGIVATVHIEPLHYEHKSD